MKTLGAFLTLVGILCSLPIHAADDDHWDTQFGPPGTDGAVYGIACGGGRVYVTGLFYSAGEAATVGFAYWDGANWGSFGPGFTVGQNPAGLAVATRGPEVFVGGAFITNLSGVTVKSLARWDGSSWSDMGGGVNGVVGCILVTEHNVFIGGIFSQVSGVNATNIARWDGTNWHAMGDGVFGYTNGFSASAAALAVATNGDVIVGGNFRYAGGVEVNNMARWDGSQWHPLGNGVFNGGSSLRINDVKVLGGNVYVAGVFRSASGVNATNLARWDGTQWHAMGGGPSGTNSALAIVGTNIFTAGNFTNIGGAAARHVARWNGSAWEALAPGGAGEILTSVSCLAADGTNLYAGGDFIQAGSAGALCIAKWNGSEWSALTSPKTKGTWLGGSALAVSGNDVYVGGSGLLIAGGLRPNAIAHWNGSNWDNMGGGLLGGSGPVQAILPANGNIYVGGNFTNAGGVAARNIAYWDGNIWHPMASGLNSNVYALCLHNGELFAGGAFTARGNGTGSFFGGIARWNGNDWVGLSGISALATTNAIYALESDGANLYVGGGYFIGWLNTNPPYDSRAIVNVGYWDGSAWWPMGSGLNGRVNEFQILGTDLYAGGSFTASGASTMRRLAKWSGGAWSEVGGGFTSGTVSGLGAAGSTLYVGGSFTNATGLTGTNRVLKWTGGDWQTLGSGVTRISPSSSSVSDIAVSGDDVYMVGSFTYAGGRPSAALARWNETLSFVPPTLRILDPGFNGLGQFQFNISGLSAGSFTVQASTTLTNWSDIHSDSVPNTNFTDLSSATIPKRMYRVKSP